MQTATMKIGAVIGHPSLLQIVGRRGKRPEGIDLCNWVGGPLDPVGSESIDKTAWHNCE
jgi:hypothetical protein